MITKGISFGNIHSYNDLDLLLSSVEIVPAPIKENYIEKNGGDGSLDLTEAHGKITYGDRKNCKFIFTMNPANDLSDSAFEEKKMQVSNALNGKHFERIILDKDPDYFYTGRCTVNNYLSDKRIRQIVVNARLNPWKHKVNETIYSFELNGSDQTFILENGRKPIVPVITCSSDIVIVFQNSSIGIQAGTHKHLAICLTEGINILKISGNGTVVFSYTEGEL